jgi:hypothetical protein
MRMADEKTWPKDVLDYLDQFGWVFKAWESRGRNRASVTGTLYDEVVIGFRAVLQRHTLHGYHCTRLTAPEISAIISGGMQPLSGAKLRDRISALHLSGLITPEFARLLSLKNYADDQNRQGMIWFIFFPPHRVPERGVDHFFRYWGGESLYMPHQSDGFFDPKLGQIGTPCLVEADVPITILNEHSFLDTIIARRYLKRRGFRTRESVDGENYAKHPIPAAAIRRIIRFPSRDFVRLTRCDRWQTPLHESLSFEAPA